MTAPPKPQQAESGDEFERVCAAFWDGQAPLQGANWADLANEPTTMRMVRQGMLAALREIEARAHRLEPAITQVVDVGSFTAAECVRLAARELIRQGEDSEAPAQR